MTLKIIRTNQAPAPVGPYNQAIAAKGTMLFVAGQIPLNPETGEIVGGNYFLIPKAMISLQE